MDHRAFGNRRKIRPFGGSSNIVLGQFMPLGKHHQIFFNVKRCIVTAGVTSWKVSNLRI